MEMVKKNIVSILCGVVAIAAIVAWFWPVGGMFGQLQTELDERAAKYKEVEQLRTAERKLPSLVLEVGGQEPLTRFPNEKVIQVGEVATKALTEQSNRMLKTVSDRNVHQPLVPNSLPRPLGRTRFDFVEDYLARLGWGPEEWKDPKSIPAELKATRPPSNEEIQEIALKIWDEKYAVRIVRIGQQTNEQQIGAEFQEENFDLDERERRKRALENVIYMDDESLAISPDIVPGKAPTDPQIWFAQNVLWIEEDVAKAINAANKGAKNVLDAPVKHLVSLRTPFAVDQYVLPGPAMGAAAATADGTPPVIPTDANGAPAVFIASPTGRVSNDLYDVIHFELILRVDYRKIPQVLAELERDRLFTVLSTGVSAVDAAAEKLANGYVYGDQPVAEITLTCEALFLRSWTVDKENNYKAALMPEVVQMAVGAKPPPAGAVPLDPSMGMSEEGMMPGEY